MREASNSQHENLNPTFRVEYYDCQRDDILTTIKHNRGVSFILAKDEHNVIRVILYVTLGVKKFGHVAVAKALNLVPKKVLGGGAIFKGERDNETYLMNYSGGLMGSAYNYIVPDEILTSLKTKLQQELDIPHLEDFDRK